MSVIIRLQNLPWTANALDIRRFFQGLQIPDGGVHIVGGDKGDAFIAFGTDEDARRAMMQDGRTINETPIKLYLSSKAEMQNVIAVARSAPAPPPGPVEQRRPQPELQPPPAFGPPRGAPPAFPPSSGPPSLSQGFGAPPNHPRDPFGAPYPGHDMRIPGLAVPPPTSMPQGLAPSGMAGIQAPNNVRPHNPVFPVVSRGPPGVTEQRPPLYMAQSRFAPPASTAPTHPGVPMNIRGPMGGQLGLTSPWERPPPIGHASNFARPPAQVNLPPPGVVIPTAVLPTGGVQRDVVAYPPVGRDLPPQNQPIRRDRFPSNGILPGQPPSMPGRGIPPHSTPTSAQSLPSLRQDVFTRDSDNRVGPPMYPRNGPVLMDQDTRLPPKSRPALPFEHSRQPLSEFHRDDPPKVGVDRKEDRHDLGRRIENDRYREPRRETPTKRESRYDRRDDDNRRLRSRSPVRKGSPRRDRKERSPRRDRSPRRERSPRKDRSPRRERSPISKRERDSDRREGHRDKIKERDRGRDRDRKYSRDDTRSRGHEKNDSRSREVRSDISGRLDNGREPKVFLFASHLPDNVNYKDVRRFFSGCEIPRDGLKLINDDQGKRNGTSFIKFVDEHIAAEALKLNGEFIGESKVHLTFCTEIEFETAIDSYRPPDKVRDHTHEIDRGFDRAPPFARSPRADYPSKDIRDRPDSRDRSRDDIAPRLSPPRRPPPREFYDRAPQRDNRHFSKECTPPRRNEGNCVVLKNLPIKVERDDIRNFFAHLNITKTGVYIEYDNLGRSLGNAYVEFLTYNDYNEALKMHKKLLHGTQLHIFPISQVEKDERVNSHKDQQRETKLRNSRDGRELSPARHRSRSPVGIQPRSPLRPSVRSRTPPRGPPPRSRSPPPRGPPPRLGLPPRSGGPPTRHEDTMNGPDLEGYHCVKMKGLPYNTGVRTITEFFGGIEIPDGGIHILCYPNGQATGTAYVEFMTNVDCKTGLERDMNYIGKRYISVTPILKDDMFTEMKNFTEQPPPVMPSGQQDYQGPAPPGVKIVLKNVPYACKPMELMGFFRGYNPIPNSVEFFLHADGKPTGQASIKMANLEAAENAVRNLNCRAIRGRAVTMQLG